MFKIKDITIHGNFVFAPMAGFSDSPYRKIVRNHGAALVFTEMITAEGLVRNNKKTSALTSFTEEERPIAIQIFGKDPDVMAEAASIVEGLGPDLIDINMGCCASRVCNHGSGAALLKDTSLIAEIAEKITRRVSLPVSAKIRIGWDHDSLNYLEVVRVLQGSGISMITVHGRTRSQKYKDKADWEIIKSISENADIPVIGNGDISSHLEANDRLTQSGCAAVMIGRCAIGNPWIFSGKTPSKKEITDQIRKHLMTMIEFYGPHGIILMRKHMVKYIKGIKNAASLRQKLVHSTSVDEINDILREIL